MKKEINKRTTLWIIGLFITIVTIFVLNIRVCAPCTYQFNNRDYKGACTKECNSIPTWKLLLFNITGNNFEFKGGSQIMPKPL